MVKESSGVPREAAKAEALAGFQERGAGHLNCAQSVLYFSLRSLGHDPGSIVAARYLGGGMVRLGHLCGVLSGAALALGFRDLNAEGGDEVDAAAVTAQIQGIVRDFEEEFGATDCRTLTGHDLTTRDGYRAFAASDARLRCTRYVEWACDRVGEII